MESITAQILHIQAAGGLSVNIGPLESILLTFSKTLSNHEVLFSQVPEMERAQSELWREVNKLRKVLESACNREKIFTDTKLESTMCLAADSQLQNVAEEQDDHCEHFYDSYGLRIRQRESINDNRKQGIPAIDRLAAIHDLRDVKAAIRKLQQYYDEGLVSSIDLDRRVQSLKKELLGMHQKLSTVVNISQLQLIQQSLGAKYSHIETCFEDFKAKFQEEVERNINQFSSDMKSAFTHFEGELKDKQNKIDTRVASCASEHDVAAFNKTFLSEITALTRKYCFLDDTAKAQGEILIWIQKRNAVAMFHRHYIRCKRGTLKLGMTRWKQVTQQQVKYELDKVLQKRCIKKILTHLISRRKRFGLGRWLQYRGWHQARDRMRMKALKLLFERISTCERMKKTATIRKWHRSTTIHKIRYSHCESLEELNSTQTLELSSPKSGQQTRYDLKFLIESLKTDDDAVSCVLAKEIENIKSHDLCSLRCDMKVEDQKILSFMTLTIDKAIEKVHHAAITSQSAIDRRIDNCGEEFTLVHSQLKEVNNILKSHKAHMRNLEDSHAKRLDIIFHRTDSLEQRMCTVEESSRATSDKVQILTQEQSKFKETIQHISHLIEKNEKQHSEERAALRDVMDHFGDELLRTKVNLSHTQVRCDRFEKDQAQTKNELSYFQDTAQYESEKVQNTLNHPGIMKPKLDRLVSVGHAYETLAKERNYVPGINVKLTMMKVVQLSMKSQVEKRRHEEEIDVPDEIAAFAHDYADWIAYQATHEALLRLIVGVDPDEKLFTEDDIIARKGVLLEDVKVSLSKELERVACVPADSADTTSRGGCIRWEARALFVARVIDATKVALSKHDPILLPSSTRLGRVGSNSTNVTVCVACDRPMRTKQSTTARKEGENVR